MKYKIILVLILLLASVLRFYKLDEHGIFTDEKYSLLNSNGMWVGAANQPEIINNKYFTPSDFWQPKNIRDYFEAIAHSDFGTHITYNAFLHHWVSVFGPSDFTIRTLSVLFNLLTILLVYFLIKRVYNSEYASLLSAFFIAVEPLNIALSRQARSYSLSFLLVILSTYLFILILEKTSKKKNILLLIYAFIVACSLLNHYLNFLVPLSHALVFIFTKKDKKLWSGFILAGIFNVAVMSWWLTFGGGYLTADFLKDKNNKHLKMAQMDENPIGGAVEISKPDVVLKKTASMFYDSSVISHSVYDKLNGLKNIIISIIMFLLLLNVFWLIKKKKPRIAYFFIVLIILLIGLYWRHILTLIPAIILYYLLFNTLKYISIEERGNNKMNLALICLLLLVLPLCFVVFDAFKSGHTTSLTHRYIGVASPFLACLMGIGFYLINKNNKKTTLPLIIIILGCQFWPVSLEIQKYYYDNSSKYGWYSPERIKNPYMSIAQIVEKTYQSGDTLIIPGGYSDLYDEYFGREAKVSYKDAQYLNIYFNKKDSFIERVDINEKDKFYIVNNLNQKKEIFDLKGSKLRY